MVATAIIGSAIVGGAATMFGASQAAKAQTSAADKATQAELQMYNRTRSDLSPYIQAGAAATPMLMGAIPGIAKPIELTQEWLEGTPGYKWNLAQGLKSVYNSASARGLGASGAAIKGGAAYASGLADTTYQNQFNNALANKTMALKALSMPVEMGANAAAGLGNIGAGTASNIGSNIVGAGNAQAGSYMAMANAGANMANSLATAAMGKQMGLY